MPNVENKNHWRNAAYFRHQRQQAEAREAKGSTAATVEAGKIHQKAGRKLTGAEGDMLLKPGPSEDEQRSIMMNLTSPGQAAMAILGTQYFPKNKPKKP